MSLPRFVVFRLIPFLLALCVLVALGSLLTQPVSILAPSGEEGEKDGIIARRTSYYSVKAEWPIVGIARVDDESGTHAKTLVEAFLAEVEDTIFEMQGMDKEEASYLYRSPRELSVAYELFEESPRAVSILWNVYSYTGGAHGMLDLTTNNYDRTTGFPLLLEDLFLDLDLAMVLFAREARNRLAEPDEDGRILPDDMLRAGTEPTEENFRAFILTADGIRVYFSPYQVAPWAAGPQHVDVSLEALAPAKPRLEYWGK